MGLRECCPASSASSRPGGARRPRAPSAAPRGCSIRPRARPTHIAPALICAAVASKARAPAGAARGPRVPALLPTPGSPTRSSERLGGLSSASQTSSTSSARRSFERPGGESYGRSRTRPTPERKSTSRPWRATRRTTRGSRRLGRSRTGRRTTRSSARATAERCARNVSASARLPAARRCSTNRATVSQLTPSSSLHSTGPITGYDAGQRRPSTSGSSAVHTS